MPTSSIVLIVVIVIAAILLIAAIVWVARNKRNEHRHVAAEEIREAARDETPQVRQREARATRPPPGPAPLRLNPTSRQPKRPVCNSRPSPTAARQRPPATSSTSSGTARTRWIRPRKHPICPELPTARNTKPTDRRQLKPRTPPEIATRATT